MWNKRDLNIIVWLIALSILIVLNVLWMVLEVIFYGEVQHRIVDDIIAMPIMYSIYLNVKYEIIDKYNR